MLPDRGILNNRVSRNASERFTHSTGPTVINSNRLMNLATICVVLVTGVIAWQRLFGTDTTPESSAGHEYALLSDLAGDPVSLVNQSLDGQIDTLYGPGAETLLYVFSTSCQYCDSQRTHIGSLLMTLEPSVRVVTASPEPTETTAAYWTGDSLSLPAPLSLSETIGKQLNLRSVPRLYHISRNGTIRRALTGTVLSWSPDSLRAWLGQ